MVQRLRPAETEPSLMPVAGPAETQPQLMPAEGPAETQPQLMPAEGPVETQPSVLMPATGPAETQPFIKIFFSVERGPGNIISKEGYCDMIIPINRLMEKFETKFGIPGDLQEWYHGEILLDHCKNLHFYGISCIRKNPIIRVQVKS